MVREGSLGSPCCSAGTQKDLKAEDKLGGGQGRLWSRAAGGPGEKQQCVPGGALWGQVSSQGAGWGGEGP